MRRLSSARNAGSTGLHQRARRLGEMPSACVRRSSLALTMFTSLRRLCGVCSPRPTWMWMPQEASAFAPALRRARTTSLNHLDVLPAAHRADHLGAGVGDRAIALDRQCRPSGMGTFQSPRCRPTYRAVVAEVPRWRVPPARSRDRWSRPQCRKSGFSRGFLPFARRLLRPRRRPVFQAATHSSLCAAEIATR